MRQFILSLLACLCLTAYSQTTSQADLLVEEAQKLESKQDYPTAITKQKQASVFSCTFPFPNNIFRFPHYTIEKLKIQ